MSKPTFDEVLSRLQASGLNSQEDRVIALNLWNGETRQHVIYTITQEFSQTSPRRVDLVIHRIGWDITWRKISPLSRVPPARSRGLASDIPTAKTKPSDMKVVLERLGDSPAPWEYEVAQQLWNGENVSAVRDTLHCGDSKIQFVAAKIGWDITWRNISHLLEANRPPHRAGSMTAPEIVRLYMQENLTLQAIGKKAGVSRERIRQILESTGIDHTGNRLRTRIALRERTQEMLRRHRKEGKYAKSRAGYLKRHALEADMWDRGFTHRQIAAARKTTVFNISSIIHRGRRMYGMFPYRYQRYDPKLKEARAHLCATLLARP